VLRAGCDLMVLFAIFDEYTDISTPREAQQLATIIVDAMRNPEKARPADECVAGEVARQYVLSLIRWLRKLIFAVSHPDSGGYHHNVHLKVYASVLLMHSTNTRLQLFRKLKIALNV
ncbi:hypothetical protein C0993_008707, partial [Termitomyces sp. T159_Od127]